MFNSVRWTLSALQPNASGSKTEIKCGSATRKPEAGLQMGHIEDRSRKGDQQVGLIQFLLNGSLGRESRRGSTCACVP